MKKVIAIIAILCMILSMTACGGKKEGNVEVDNGEGTKPTTNIENTEQSNNTTEPDETLPPEEIVLKDYWITISTDAPEVMLTIDNNIGELIRFENGEATFANGTVITEMKKISGNTFKGRLCSEVTADSIINIKTNDKATMSLVIQIEGKEFSVNSLFKEADIYVKENAIMTTSEGNTEINIKTEDKTVKSTSNVATDGKMIVTISEMAKNIVVNGDISNTKVTINEKTIDAGNNNPCVISLESGEPILLDTKPNKK